jgi:hypothetical protein
MAPLTVDPGALDRAGTDVVSAGESLGWTVMTLTMALLGCAGMAGDDPAGARLGHGYDGSAAKLMEAMATTRDALCSLGTGVRMSAHNYSLAEARADVGGQSNPLPAPTPIERLLVGAPPSSVGPGDDAPPGWGWVSPLIGMIWPTADSAKLRTAAAAWTATGTKFALTEIEGTGRAIGAVRAQQIPEGAAIDAAFSDAYDSTTNIVAQCQTIAAQLASYAAKVDKVHAAILDLLARICDPLTGIKEVWDILTDEDEDEIKKIADDIRTVVDNFTAEVDALRAQIAAVLEQATAVITSMGDHAVKQWDQFSRAVDPVLTQLGQFGKGFGEEAFGLAKGLWEVSQVRAVTDPVGWLNSMGEMTKGIAPLVGGSGEHGPDVGQAWQQLGKELTHWDDWKSHPFEALGKTGFDLATMALPGGPVTKLGKIGTGARDALEGLDAAKGLDAVEGLRKPPTLEPLTPPRVEPPKFAPPGPEPAPRAVPRESAPQTKPAPTPAGTPAPHSPTESKTPVAREPGAGHTPSPANAPASKDAPAAPAAQHPGSAPIAPTNEPTPLHPQPTEPASARAPALPRDHSGQPAPGAAHPRHPAPGPSAPHAPAAHSVPAESVPLRSHHGEPSPHGGETGGPSQHGALQSPESTLNYPDYSENEPRTTISGHGAYYAIDGHIIVPRGTTITIYAEHGSSITDELGNLIESGGDTSRVYSRTFHPGEKVPNYTIYPPDGLNVMGAPRIVATPTRLTELIEADMGDVHLAICPFDEANPTGLIYDVGGVYDESTGIFAPYEGIDMDDG